MERRIFIRTVTVFVILGVLLYLLFTLLINFFGKSVFSQLGSGYSFIFLALIVSLFMSSLLILIVNGFRIPRHLSLVIAISISVPGMLLDSVVLRYVDYILPAMNPYLPIFSSILLFAYGAILATGLVLYQEN